MSNCCKDDNKSKLDAIQKVKDSLILVEPEYVYITIPAEYICVYHKILALLADYGEALLADCSARCNAQNENVVACWQMFNAAVAARKLGQDKLAATLIKYIKAKLNQIYKGISNDTSFVFPIDENGDIKAFVSCGERPRFEIAAEDGELYKHKFHDGFDEHFALDETDDSSPVEKNVGLHSVFKTRVERHKGDVVPCGDLTIYYNGKQITDYNNAKIEYYFDGVKVDKLTDVRNPEKGFHEITVLVVYNNHTDVTLNALEV